MLFTRIYTGKYFGEKLNDMRHGLGLYVRDNAYLIGIWKENKPHGDFEITKENVFSFKFIFNNGRFDGDFSGKLYYVNFVINGSLKETEREVKINFKGISKMLEFKLDVSGTFDK